MKKIKIFAYYDLPVDLEYEKQIELYIDQIPNTKVPNDTIRFLILQEPPEVINLIPQALKGFELGTYNFLLTHHEELIDNTDKAHLFPYGTTWIHNYKFPKKKFEISTLVGGKLIGPGHHLRRKLWFKENRINVPTNFYLSGNFDGGIENYNNNPILGSKKEPLFDSQFHICIENTRRKYHFTEKLIDCFQTKTIPIYWGCPNIGEWFDERGMIIVKDIKEIFDACNSLTADKYQNMLPYVEKNFEKSKEFTNFGERIKNKIIEIIKNE